MILSSNQRKLLILEYAHMQFNFSERSDPDKLFRMVEREGEIELQLLMYPDQIMEEAKELMKNPLEEDRKKDE
jgi:hypothetical protein